LAPQPARRCRPAAGRFDDQRQSWLRLAGPARSIGSGGRAERLAWTRSPAKRACFVPFDVHAGNIRLMARMICIVDWDDPILAPKERDLMYPGGAQGFVGRPAHEEEALFYRGYGPAAIDPEALAYYRYERIVQDIAIYCELILTTGEARDDRAQSLRYLASNFMPNNTIEMAYRSDRRADG
jgi:hypothetical protein